MTAQVHTLFDAPAPADGFDRFWDWVPRKKGKKAARKAYSKALAGYREDGEVYPPVDPSVLLDGVKRWHAQWRALTRQGKDLQFCQHPSTWLNGRGWEDEDGVLTSPDETDGITALSDVQGPAGAQWQRIVEHLHRSDPAGCASWVLPLRLTGFDRDGNALLQAPSPFFARHVDQNGWLQLIKRAWQRGVVVR